MLRLALVEDDASAYSLVSGEIVIGVLRLEIDKPNEEPNWYFSIYALHQIDIGVTSVGLAPNVGDAFALADRQWGLMIGKLGLKPAEA